MPVTINFHGVVNAEIKNKENGGRLWQELHLTDNEGATFHVVIFPDENKPLLPTNEKPMFLQEQAA